MKYTHVQETMCRPVISFSVQNGLSTPIDLIHPEFLGYTNTCFDEGAGTLDMSYLSEPSYKNKEMVLILNDEVKRAFIESTFIEPVFGVSYFPVTDQEDFNICINPLTAIDVFSLYIDYLHMDEKFVRSIKEQREAIYAGKLSFDFETFINDKLLLKEFKIELETLIPDLFDITYYIKR